MDKQLSFELKVLSGKQENTSMEKHLSSEKENKPKRETKKKRSKKKVNNKREHKRKQAVKELLPELQKETKLDLGCLSLKDNVQEKKASEINILSENFSEEQIPKKDMFFENQIFLIGVEAVAEMLGLAPKTIHNWVSLRKIPYLKCGHKIMFRPKSLKAWLNRKEVKSWL